jgi:hypothetical protein
VDELTQSWSLNAQRKFFRIADNVPEETWYWLALGSIGLSAGLKLRGGTTGRFSSDSGRRRSFSSASTTASCGQAASLNGPLAGYKREASRLVKRERMRQALSPDARAGSGARSRS